MSNKKCRHALAEWLASRTWHYFVTPSFNTTLVGKHSHQTTEGVLEQDRPQTSWA